MLSRIDNSPKFKIHTPQKASPGRGDGLACATSPILYDTFNFSNKEKNKVNFEGREIFEKFSNRQRAKEIIKDENLPDLKLGAEINRGNEAVVYGVKNNPEWVVRVEHKSKADLSELGNCDLEDNPNIITSTKTGECQILKKLNGEPLYGKNWKIGSKISSIRYFQEIKKIKEIPDEAFAKYCRDVMKLRKNSIEIDTINPNNILYDKEKKEFNLVDTKKKIGVREKLYIQDFYPFIDAKRLPTLYKHSGDLARYAIGKSIREFLDRMVRIAKQEGYEIKVEDINRHWVQDFVTYLYHDDQRMLFQYMT